MPGRDEEQTHDVTQPAGPVAWPDGGQAAAFLGFDMDAEDVALTVDPESRHRLSAMSHQAYGPLTGMPRVLELLRRHDLRATFFCPGYTAERYPDLLRRVRDEGHEIAHHGYLHEAIAGMTPAAGGRRARPRPRRAGAGRRGPAGRVPRADVGDDVRHRRAAARPRASSTTPA